MTENGTVPLREITGGATIGWWRASRGLATLRIGREQLQLHAGSRTPLVFEPGDVVAIESFTYLPFLSWGLRIKHVRPDVPERVLFFTFGSPKHALAIVREVGFVGTAVYRR